MHYVEHHHEDEQFHDESYVPRHYSKNTSCTSHARSFVGNSFQADSTPKKCWFNKTKVSAEANFAYNYLNSDYVSGVINEQTVANGATVSSGEQLDQASESDQSFQLNNANIFIDSILNTTTNVHLNIHYGDNNIFAGRLYGIIRNSNTNDL